MKATVINTVKGTTKVVELPEDVKTVRQLAENLEIERDEDNNLLSEIFEGATRTNLHDGDDLPQLPESKKESGYAFFVSPSITKIANASDDRQKAYRIIRDNGLAKDFGIEYVYSYTNAKTKLLVDYLKDKGLWDDKKRKAKEDPTQNNSPVFEKTLWKTLIKLLNTNDLQERSILVDKLKRQVNEVFKNPYSAQDLQNMRIED